MSDSNEVYEQGIAVRDEMLGSEHGRAKVESQSAVHRRLREHGHALLLRRGLDARGQLSRAHRSMITLAMLIALGRPHEIRVHVKGAIANGVTKEQISEIMMHSAIYCGVPAAVDGFRQASAMLEELGLRERAPAGSPRRLRRPRQHGRPDGAQPRPGGLRADRARPERRRCRRSSSASSARRARDAR